LEEFKVNTLEELETQIAKYGDDVLFRGQTSYYGLPGKPSVITSFERNVCIPSKMLKWSQYAKNVLDVFVNGRTDSFEYQQALLQHYGWRSFFVDCSSNAAVSAWFASHSFSLLEPYFEISEDYQERSVFLVKQKAEYIFSEGLGHLFILDRTACRKVGLVDLADLSITGFRPRTIAQSAWMVGPLQSGPLPDDCFVAHITVDRSLLRDYAAKNQLSSTEDLFPSVKDDPILKALLGLPWRQIKYPDNKCEFKVFRRSLDVPEYHDSFVKIFWPHTAFYCGDKISDKFSEIAGDTVGGTIISAPDTILFGTAPKSMPLKFPHIENLVDKYGSVFFEIDDLIQHASTGNLTVYQKGIGIIPRGKDLYELCELGVDHPGLDMTRVGVSSGWYYRKGSDGLWVREYNENECPCESEFVHERHISALHIAEDFVSSPKNLPESVDQNNI
jgi:FRG domain.